MEISKLPLIKSKYLPHLLKKDCFHQSPGRLQAEPPCRRCPHPFRSGTHLFFKVLAYFMHLPSHFSFPLGHNLWEKARIRIITGLTFKGSTAEFSSVMKCALQLFALLFLAPILCSRTTENSLSLYSFTLILDLQIERGMLQEHRGEKCEAMGGIRGTFTFYSSYLLWVSISPHPRVKY